MAPTVTEVHSGSTCRSIEYAWDCFQGNIDCG
eukprot:CAMPEP_0202717136 /NCGR_PEP_ID=MMETSP1385-20130828/108531_1 /ASSEMBLY_ACC=CAM_ASM_000861 /TAXON_ID=933848 /ORGANISM="Elphidium margaritaceum" /LENGTH=31 /DNA_ID= /DNA_START= /DNA_END= /DNA_ORIENTATION=